MLTWSAKYRLSAHKFDYYIYKCSVFLSIMFGLTVVNEVTHYQAEHSNRTVVARIIPTLAKGDISMATGTVKWFNPTKGFGFIEPTEGGSDVFVHISAVEASSLNGLNEGDKIEFDIQEEKGKQSASNLKEAA